MADRADVRARRACSGISSGVRPGRHELAEVIDQPQQRPRVGESRGLNTRRPAQLHEQFVDERRLPLGGVLLWGDQVEREQTLRRSSPDPHV